MIAENLASLIDTAFLQKRDVFERITEATEKYGMIPLIKKGVAVGFSGGPDSVLLLIFLYKMQKSINFPLIAVHVNHNIRKDTAKRDEDFSREFCAALGIDFYAYGVDVPKYAKNMQIGIEEAAREKRYEIFKRACAEHFVSTVATAHNATDNLETLIFRMMRGTGAKGLLGISPVRENIIRPIIEIPKSDIVSLLDEFNIPYVVDETNFSCEYTRNYVRHEILPAFKRLNPNPENAALRLIENLRSDVEYLDLAADRFIELNQRGEGVDANALAKEHSAVASRVIVRLTTAHTDASAEAVHIAKILDCLHKGNSFSVSLPGKTVFVRRGDVCFACREEDRASEIPLLFKVLKDGFNELPELGIGIAVTDSKFEDFSSNVYKISIQADLHSAIINDVLYVRRRQEGDAYFYGGINRKLKKLFIDKKIPQEKRDTVPIICDASGIVWVPGFGVRSDRKKGESGEHKWITIYAKQ